MTAELEALEARSQAAAVRDFADRAHHTGTCAAVASANLAGDDRDAIDTLYHVLER